jgi:hypothetical protein
VLFAHGSRFGGHALYLKDNRLHYVYNFVGITEQRIDATEDLTRLPAGDSQTVTDDPRNRVAETVGHGERP